MSEMNEIYRTMLYDKIDPIRFEVFLQSFKVLAPTMLYSGPDDQDSAQVLKEVLQATENVMQAALNKMEGLEIIQRASTPLPITDYQPADECECGHLREHHGVLGCAICASCRRVVDSFTMYTSSHCLTSRHRSCADAACRCLCHKRADDTNQGPSTKEFWRKWELDKARRRLERDKVILQSEVDQVGAIGPADVARLSDPGLHPCAYCSKPTHKDFTICDECFDRYEKGKTAEERREQRAER